MPKRNRYIETFSWLIFIVYYFLSDNQFNLPEYCLKLCNNYYKGTVTGRLAVDDSAEAHIVFVFIQPMNRPPFRLMTCPVMKLASSLAR